MCECYMCLRGQRRVLDSLKLVCEPPDMGMRTELRFSARAANISPDPVKNFYGFLPPTFVRFNYFPSFLR